VNIAIIPARGGSKRIPRKNIKHFHGQPMISYSIKAAIDSKCFDSIIVSTDDKEIALIANEYGAKTPFIRPTDISDDFSTTSDVMAHAVKYLLDNDVQIDNVCCIYATAPFINSEAIQTGFSELVSSEADYVFSATTFPFPIQRAIKLNEELSVEMFEPQHMYTRSQDLEEAYHDAGQFYWGKVDSFLLNKPIFTENSKAIILPRSRVQDIDTPEDWDLAEALYGAMK
jgi:N-acylneuraminate cytidylyltransferase